MTPERLPGSLVGDGGAIVNEAGSSVGGEIISPGQGSLRLFIAVELAEDVKQALREAITTLKRAGVDEGLRWARPEGIHLTLKFLGATARAKVAAIATAIREALAGATAFELRPEGLGTFHGGRNLHFTRKFPREAYPSTVRVLWVGLSGETDRLAELAARIETALEPHGVEREKRPFSAHLTLARVRDEADRATRERLSHALAPYASRSTMVVGRFDADRVPRFPPFRVDRVSLMQSTLQRGGAVYHAVETFALR